MPISCRSQDEIKKGRRKQIELYHPDKVNNLGKEFIELANEKTKDINMAYEILISWLNCNDNYNQANEKHEYNDSKDNEEEKEYAKNQWICPKCNTKNSNYAFLCTKCGYLNQKQWENGQ